MRLLSIGDCFNLGELMPLPGAVVKLNHPGGSVRTCASNPGAGQGRALAAGVFGS